MNFLKRLNHLLTEILYKLRVKKEKGAEELPLAEAQTYTIPEGTHGRLDAAAVLLADNDNLVLSVNHDFQDVPSWIEWDMQTKRLSVAQMGGAVAELKLELPLSEQKRLEQTKRLALVSGTGSDRIMHYIAFLVRAA